MKPALPSPRRLSRMFSLTIRGWLTHEQLVELNRLNAGESAICHSHDFCDANEAMNLAFEDLAKRSFDPLDEVTDLPLVNEAWRLARVNGFGHPPMCCVGRVDTARRKCNRRSVLRIGTSVFCARHDPRRISSVGEKNRSAQRTKTVVLCLEKFDTATLQAEIRRRLDPVMLMSAFKPRG